MPSSIASDREAPASAGGRHVGIVGGGMLGLGLALRLVDQGHRVTVLEAAPTIGGLTRADAIGDITWDRFYHVTLLSDRYLLELLEQIGLADRLQWRTTRTGFYVDGRLVPMSSSLDFAMFPPLGPVSKARLAWTILAAARIADPRPLEQVTAVEWLTRLSGRRTVERIWLPLLRSKLGPHAQDASAAFIWAIIARLYAARRSGLKREMFGYVEGGYANALERLRTVVQERGVEIQCGRPAAAVRGDDRGAEVRFGVVGATPASPAVAVRATPASPNGASAARFDDVILTVPCGQVATLCPQLTSAEQERLRKVVYQGVICPSLLLRKPLAGYYVTNITDSWVPFTGVIEMTALVDPATFGGNSLVYLPRYLSQQDPTWQRTDESLVEDSIDALRRMYPDFRPEDVVASRVARARDVLAISTRNYSRDCLPPLETSIDHVFVVNSAQIAYGTLNVNETLALAARQAAALANYLNRGVRGSGLGVRGGVEDRGLRPQPSSIGSRTGDARTSQPSEPVGATHASPFTQSTKVSDAAADLQFDPAPRNPNPDSRGSRPLASVSLDVDNLWSYMKTHGDAGWEQRPSYYDAFFGTVLPVLDELGIRLTFFIVGRDAAVAAHATHLRAAIAAGHELGNHSFEHEPWLDRYTPERVATEIADAEQAIQSASGQRPIGFRGPGYSWTPALFEVLVDRGYLYDASTLPTYLGPLARAYYFWTARLTPAQREERATLFGGARDGLRPVRPYRWSLPSGRSLLEIPVTTIPGIKIPFHLSYLLYLSRVSEAAMVAYLRTAVMICRLTGTEPSFLLHPLDLLGYDAAPELRFFPGMDLTSARKKELFARVMRVLGAHFRLVNMSTHARAIVERGGLKSRVAGLGSRVSGEETPGPLTMRGPVSTVGSPKPDTRYPIPDTRS